MAKLSQQQAEGIQKKIQSICDQYDLWNTVEYDRRPGLNMITMTVKIKVDELGNGRGGKLSLMRA